jgi:thioredoxin 1
MTETTGDAGSTAPPDRPQPLADAADLTSFRESHAVALVEFYTDGCGICASMEPVISGLARDAGLAVGTINPRDDPDLVEAFDVRSVPLLVLFQDGAVVARRSDGFVGVDELRQWVESHLDAE